MRGQRMSQPQPCPPGADPGGDWWTRPATSTNVSSVWNPRETMLPRALQRPGPCPCPSPHTPGPEQVRNCLGMDSGCQGPRLCRTQWGRGRHWGAAPAPSLRPRQSLAPVEKQVQVDPAPPTDHQLGGDQPRGVLRAPRPPVGMLSGSSACMFWACLRERLNGGV